jgi:hypothetical protein
MPDQPKKLATYEDILRELGPEKMAFISEMVRPDQHEEREDEADLPTTSASREVILTPEEERAVIEGITAYFGRKPTPEEIHLALEQARSI